MTDRYSEAGAPILISDPLLAAQVESENALRQFDAAMDDLGGWISNGNNKLRPSQILRLHGILLAGLSSYAGNYRPAIVEIKGSRHTPPPANKVAVEMEDLWEYVNNNWKEKSAIHLSAYVLWRLNWIHAFVDGNGRTARVVSYFVLCAHCRTQLPGDLTIPEQIASNKEPYYDGLEAADRAAKKGLVDLSELEALLGSHLANQLYDFHRSAVGNDSDIALELEDVLKEARSAGSRDRGAALELQLPLVISRKPGMIGWIEAHPAMVGLIGVFVAATLSLITAIFSGK